MPSPVALYRFITRIDGGANAAAEAFDFEYLASFGREAEDIHIAWFLEYSVER
jgi:hypothetical protein